MVINCFLNATFRKVVKTKLVKNYRAYIRKKSKMVKMQHNSIYIISNFDKCGLMTVYEKLSKTH